MRPSKPESLEVVVTAQRHLCRVHLAGDDGEWVTTLCRVEAEKLLGRPMPRGTSVKGSLVFLEDESYANKGGQSGR